MRKFLVSASVTIITCAALTACNSSQPPAAVGANAPPYQPVTDLKQLMAWVFEPNAQVAWKSVGTIITADGQQDIAPQTDDDWNRVRDSAATVAEAANLLMMEGRARNQDDWMKKSRNLLDKATIVLQAAEAKDSQGVFTAGSDMYLACSECHAVYAFPQQ